jgi:hypothetical protein
MRIEARIASVICKFIQNFPGVVNKELEDAIEKLYDIFVRYPLSNTEGCPCCVHEKDQRQLRSAPLRKLSGDALGRYSGKAMSTWGDADDFRHFLPRMMELLVSDEYIWDAGHLAEKILYGGWTQWPDDEKEAVRGFWREWWKFMLSEEKEYDDPGKAVQAILKLDPDPGYYLKCWEASSGVNAIIGLASYIIDLVNAEKKYRKEKRWPAAMVRWLKSTAVRNKLEKAFFEYSDRYFAQYISWAHQYLDILPDE